MLKIYSFKIEFADEMQKEFNRTDKQSLNVINIINVR